MPIKSETDKKETPKKDEEVKTTSTSKPQVSVQKGNGDGSVSSYTAPTTGPSSRTDSSGILTKKGVLETMPEGYGFLRADSINPGNDDIYISQSQIRRFDIRPGDEVEGELRPPKDTERYFGMLKVVNINGVSADHTVRRPRFESLTPIYPNKHLKLETDKTPISTRIIDIVSPIGYGQRGMIVSPPKAGKTTILKDIAHGVTKNSPKTHLMAVLIGERPEEVTDISRSIKGEVLASNFDDPPEHQTRVAELAMDRAKRLVETGRDVFIILDSMTRLGRAYNLALPPSGRTLSGGFDPVALFPPKKFFGAARNMENGGSLTIIATALVETGSRMDDLIYEEFKGTGNMELHLDRGLSERRIFPSINVTKSGTRNEELLIDSNNLKKVWKLRRMLETLNEMERTQLFIDRLSKTASNADFLESLHKEVS